MTNYFELAGNNLWLPYTPMLNHLQQLPVKKAKGCKIFLEDGSILLDGISSWWSVAHGYQHPHLVACLVKQAKKLSHIMLAGFANEQTYKLSYRLCQFTNMDAVFFSDSGSTAIEVAMKIAWQFFYNQKQTAKKYFVSFANSYHGDTTGAMSLADLQHGMHKKFKNLLLRNFNLPLPTSQNDLDFFANFVSKNKQQLAGVFIEPMLQCAGGMHFYDANILQGIAKITQENNILLIVDECATGFYRTGKKFAHLYANIKPDILVLGKALTGGMLTLSATLVNQKIYQQFLKPDLDSALMHGPTFMGNALACASANASLDLFENNSYDRKAKKIEQILQQELLCLANNQNVRKVEILGATANIKLQKTTWEQTLQLRQQAIKLGVFLRPFADCLYTMPALTIKSYELKKVCKAMKLLVNSI